MRFYAGLKVKMMNNDNEIDWSNAPEGATHFCTDGTQVKWYQYTETQWLFFESNGGEWHVSQSNSKWHGQLIPSPAYNNERREYFTKGYIGTFDQDLQIQKSGDDIAPKKWSGEGHPPIGVEVEMAVGTLPLQKGVVKYIGEDWFVYKIVNEKESSGFIDDYEFRPVQPTTKDRLLKKLQCDIENAIINGKNRDEQFSLVFDAITDGLSSLGDFQ